MDIFTPIEIFADQVTYTWFALKPDSYLGEAVHFFIYDLLKIGLLLILINFIMAIVRYYFPTEKIRDLLARRHWYGVDYVLAALLGMITPFCSCSSIPLFIGFLNAGIPLGVTFTFLISSPLINEASLVLFPSIFGWRITIIYHFGGIIISVLGGVLISKLKMERFIKPEFLGIKQINNIASDDKKTNITELIKYWWQDGMRISKDIFPYIIIGVGLGALIHGLIPITLIEKYLTSNEWWTIPIATIIGIPLYANSVSVIPIVEALVNKGASLGPILAFMTATVTLSIPEALMLTKVMKWQLLWAFFGITTVGIIFIGYLVSI